MTDQCAVEWQMRAPREIIVWGGAFDRTIMSPFVNRQPFYSQTSLGKLLRTAPPLTEIHTL
jgi:hypothetical protein